MAQRRKAIQRNNSHGAQAVVIFWFIFVIVIITVFMAKFETISRNFDLFKTRVTAVTMPQEELPNDALPDETVTPEIRAVPETPRETVTVEPSGQKEQTGAQAAEDKPAAQQTAVQQTQTQTTTTTTPPAQTRERAIYFTQVDKDGQILQSKVTRRIPVSDTPMQDSLKTMLTGPSADEVNRGILNIIPKNTRVLSAAIRGSTAYINFSEDFLFNTFGVEGYVAQLRQIVWTVTEFPTVNDVQILIEGRRQDYLGEGIYIGSPINRQSF